MTTTNPTNRLRHCAAATIGFAVSVVALCAAAPGAFASLVPPPGGITASTPSTTHAGTPGWEIAVVAVGVVVILSLAVAGLAHRRATVRMQRALG